MNRELLIQLTRDDIRNGERKNIYLDGKTVRSVESIAKKLRRRPNPVYRGLINYMLENHSDELSEICGETPAPVESKS